MWVKSDAVRPGRHAAPWAIGAGPWNDVGFGTCLGSPVTPPQESARPVAVLRGGRPEGGAHPARRSFFHAGEQGARSWRSWRGIVAGGGGAGSFPSVVARFENARESIGVSCRTEDSDLSETSLAMICPNRVWLEARWSWIETL